MINTQIGYIIFKHVFTMIGKINWKIADNMIGQKLL